MRAVVAALVAVALLFGGFAAYRSLSGDEERERAEAAAREYSRFGKERCDRQPATRRAECEETYAVRRIDRIAPNLWRFHVREPHFGSRCMAVDLDQFHVARESSIYVGGTVEGLSDTPCGPEWWTHDDAQRRFEDSTWARERKARLASCSAVEGAGSPNSQYFRRFRCRYISAAGDGTVTLTPTGPDTFEVRAEP
jgi:hypothetical protein